MQEKVDLKTVRELQEKLKDSFIVENESIELEKRMLR